MLRIGNNNREVVYGAIIDVGSGSVGVGVIVSNQNQSLPQVIFSHRELMSRGKGRQTKEDNVRRMREALFTATLVLAEKGLKELSAINSRARISRILVTCSSPWAHSVTRAINYENEEGIEVTNSLIEDLVATAEKQIDDDFKETEIVTTLGLKVVERATIDTKLNGYRVTDFEDKIAKTVSLYHTTGMIPEDILEAVHEVQDKILSDTTLSSHTYMLVIYCVLRDLFPKTNTYSIIDVTGESTELGVVEDGVLRYTTHSPYGSNTLLRAITEKSNGSIDDVLSQLRLESEKVSVGETSETLDTLLKPFDDAFTQAVDNLSEEAPLAKTVVLTSLPEIQSVFAKRIPFLARQILNQECTTIELSPSILQEVAEVENQDVFISIAARFFHKLHGCGTITSV